MPRLIRAIVSPTSVAVLFVVAGIAHFVRPMPYAGIIPAWLPDHVRLVYLSGAAEIAGGIGMLLPFTRRVAGIGLIALLVGVFPANIQMLVNGYTDHRSALWMAALWLRLPLQPLMIYWVWRVAMAHTIETPATGRGTEQRGDSRR